MNLWMRDMQKEDISTRNGKADGQFAQKENLRYAMFSLLNWRTAAPCFSDILHSEWRLSHLNDIHTQRPNISRYRSFKSCIFLEAIRHQRLYLSSLLDLLAVFRQHTSR